MDLDVDEGSFSSLFPLPFRVIGILILGLWTWASAFRILHSLGIPTALLLYGRRLHVEEHLVYQPAGVLALILTAYGAFLLTVFWTFTSGDRFAVFEYELLPFSFFLVFLALIAWPGNVLYKKERYKFLRTVKRVAIGGLDSDAKFADIILSDLLTSYAKVLGDVFVTTCMFWNGFAAIHEKPDQACGGVVIVPLLISVPYMIRFRQCITEYQMSAGNQALAKTHLMNALKYATAFPVIYFSALQRHMMSEPADMRNRTGEDTVFRLWVVSAVINSSYSFYWDVTKDWDLSILTSPNSPDSESLWGLRSKIHIPQPQLYYFVIALNFVLRMTWSVKLSPQFHHLNDVEGGIFLLEILEIIRRWIWIIFRVETEWVRKKSGSEHILPLSLDREDTTHDIIPLVDDISNKS